jgi:hypothetical protein
VLCSFCTSFVLFLLLLPGISYSSRVTIGVLIRSGSDRSA